jgi:hypothetical protein
MISQTVSQSSSQTPVSDKLNKAKWKLWAWRTQYTYEYDRQGIFLDATLGSASEPSLFPSSSSNGQAQTKKMAVTN